MIRAVIIGASGITGYELTKILDKHPQVEIKLLNSESCDGKKVKEVFPDKYGFELESLYWPTCHLQPVYKKLFNFKAGDFPVSESILSRQVTLPIHACIDTLDAEYAFECLVKEINSMEKTK